MQPSTKKTMVVFSAALPWVLIATVVATRKALNYRSLGRTIAVCMIGWVIQIILNALFITAMGPATETETIAV